MNILIKINIESLQALERLLGEISKINIELQKKHPDIVMNIEAELK